MHYDLEFFLGRLQNRNVERSSYESARLGTRAVARGIGVLFVAVSRAPGVFVSGAFGCISYGCAG